MRLVRRPGVLAPVCVVAAVLLGNAAYLLQLRSSDPMVLFSGLATPRHGLVTGSSTIDPNYGWTSQALGHLAATSWLQGHVPLWNLYEGLGQPLGGEMQSAALFLPFVLLQALPNGIYLMHVALELVAGLTMLGFLRSRRLGWAASTAGACLFGLNGAFSVMANAPFNPIAFLPMACWGVELIARAVEGGRRPRAGVWVTATAFAFMLFAGFPETALLEGLFVAGWAVVRLTELGRGLRRSFAGWAVAATGLGLAIAAPAIITFVDFLHFGYAAYHASSANNYSYPHAKITSLALPYATGPMGRSISAGQAGYLTLTAVTVGLAAYFNARRRRAMLTFLGVLVAVLVLNMFGIPPVKQLLNVIPGVRNVLVAKYGIALIEFAVAICAAYGIDDLRRGMVRRRGVLVAAVLVVTYSAGAMGYAAHRGKLIHHTWTTGIMVLTLGACALLAILLLRGRSAPRRQAPWPAAVAAAIVALFGLGTYATPQLSATQPVPVNLGPVHFLQDHLGTSRFYTLGPIESNYGSYWQLPQLNANDLPVPKKYADFVDSRVRPTYWARLPGNVRGQFVNYRLVLYNSPPTMQRTLLRAYGNRQKTFRDAGVRYVVMRRGVGDHGRAAKFGLVRAYRDAKVDIWQDRRAASYYRTNPACTVRTQSMTSVTLDCPTSATLVRRQLSSPDWTATINGVDHTVPDAPDRLFQSIRVPAGVSAVTFSYRPKYFVAATVLSLAVVLLLIADTGVFLMRRRRT